MTAVLLRTSMTRRQFQILCDALCDADTDESHLLRRELEIEAEATWGPLWLDGIGGPGEVPAGPVQSQTPRAPFTKDAR